MFGTYGDDRDSTRTKQYCTNSSSTWLYMLPQDCSGFHRGRYIICWQLPFKNEFTTLAKKCRYSWREVSCSRARASEGSLVRACMLWTSSEIRATPWRWNADRELLSDFWQIILWFIKLSNIKINFDQLRRVLIMASVYGNEPRVRVTHILLIGICSVPNIRTCLPRISFYALLSNDDGLFTSTTVFGCPEKLPWMENNINSILKTAQSNHTQWIILKMNLRKNVWFYYFFFQCTTSFIYH